MPVMEIKLFIYYLLMMSFLIVFNGQYSPLTHPLSPRPGVRPVLSADRSGEVKEFREKSEKSADETSRPPLRKLSAYQQTEKTFQEQKRRIYARDIMSHPVKFVTASMLTAVARELMEKHLFRHLPVLDENNQLIGMLSDREFTSVTDQKTCRDLMSNKVIVALESASINEIAIILLQHKLNALPIINHKRELVGIITQSDILRYIIEATPFLGRV